MVSIATYGNFSMSVFDHVLYETEVETENTSDEGFRNGDHHLLSELHSLILKTCSHENARMVVFYNRNTCIYQPDLLMIPV